MRLVMLLAVCLINGLYGESCCCSNLPDRFGMKKEAPKGMIWIPGGEFTMGSDNKDSKKDEMPPHRVKVDGFFMDETPVTNRQFKEFVDATGYITTAEKALL